MSREPLFDQELIAKMNLVRARALRASAFAWHDVIILEAPLTVANVTFDAGTHLRVERTFTVHEPVMQLSIVGDSRSNRSVDIGGYDLIDVKHHVIPAPSDEPF